MRVIEMFANNVFNGNKSFTLNTVCHTYHFSAITVGKADMYYGMCQYSMDKAEKCPEKESAMRLVAIVSDGTIHIVDTYILNCTNSDMPENVVRFSVDYDNESFEKTHFRHFIENLKPCDELPDYSIADIESHARRYAVTGGDVEDFFPTLITRFSDSDKMNALCGFVNLEELGNSRIEHDSERYARGKKRYLVIKDFINKLSNSMSDEISAVKAVKDSGAKTVNVTFELDGKSATGKVESDTLIRVIHSRDYFCGYNFTTTTSGNALIKKLGAETYFDRNKSENRTLTFQRITKITYGKKVLFERK